jgi:hypothetical protein
MSWPRASLAYGETVGVDMQATAIGQFLETEYALQRGGKVLVMESMWHLWEEVLRAVDEPRILVVCTGETPRGSFAEQDLWHRVDRQWTVAVVRGHGFRNLMVQSEDGDPPKAIETLAKSIETVRDLVRTMLGISEEFPVNYRGWKNLPAVARPGTANVFVAGATIEFSTANDLAEITEPTA